jgi:hypothetical protein
MSGFLYRYRNNEPVERHAMNAGWEGYPSESKFGKTYIAHGGGHYTLSSIRGFNHVLYHHPTPNSNPSHRVEVGVIDKSEKDPWPVAQQMANAHAKGIDRHVDGAGFNLDAGDVGEPSDPNDRDEFDPMMESDSGDDVHPFNWSDGVGVGDFEDSESTQGQVPPPNTGMRSDGLRDALMELHDRGKIDLFSHMADFGLDEDEAGEHADIHRMAHNWARKNGYF